MNDERPDLYFRVKRSGATVFRIEDVSGNMPMRLRPVASVNVQKASIRPNSDVELTDNEIAQIQSWIEARADHDKNAQAAEIEALVDQMNFAADWVQKHATDDELASIQERLLWSLYDLRQTIVRRHANRE